MRIQNLGRRIPLAISVAGVILTGTTMLFAQTISDVIQVADSVTSASASNPLLAVIKIQSVVLLIVIGFSAWLVRIIITQAQTNATNAATTAAAVAEFNSRPCALSHTNPQLYSKLLESCK